MVSLHSAVSRNSSSMVNKILSKNARSGTSGTTADSQNVFPRHQTQEACRKLGMTLPPVSPKHSSKSRKSLLQNKDEKKKTKPPAAVSLTIGKHLSDYVRKPVYFCHLINASNLTAGCKEEKLEKPEKIKEPHLPTLINENFHQTLCEKTQQQPINTIQSMVPASCKSAKSKNISKFKEFCEKEGYNPSTLENATTVAFKTLRKFAKISKPPHCTLWPISEHQIADSDPTRIYLPKPTILEKNLLRKPEKNSAKQAIKENARISAEHGKTAASKAISFILSDQPNAQNLSTTKRKRIVLPPLERSKLRAFTSTWNPDVSIPPNKAT